MEWDWDFAFQILPRLLEGLLVTVEVTIMASVVAIICGLPLAIARRSRNPAIWRPTYYLSEFIRRTPLLIQLYCLFYILPNIGIVLPALTAGVVCIGAHYAVYTSEVYRAGIERIPTGQWEAAKALNMPAHSMWIRVILPQAIPPMIPALGNYVIAMFKESAILYTITVLELMNSARSIANWTYRYLEPMTIVGLLYLLVSLPSAFLVRYLERRMKEV